MIKSGRALIQGASRGATSPLKSIASTPNISGDGPSHLSTSQSTIGVFHMNGSETEDDDDEGRMIGSTLTASGGSTSSSETESNNDEGIVDLRCNLKQQIAGVVI